MRVLGAKKKLLTGYSTSNATIQPHQGAILSLPSKNVRLGFIMSCHIVQSTPQSLRQKAGKIVAGKTTLLARVDHARASPNGEIGRQMRETILSKIEKLQEPPPAKQPKPLPVPDGEQKKRRGGRRLRAMKERYQLTDVRAATNRIRFNQPEEEFIDGDEVIGLGMLGKEGSGRLKMVSKQQKMKLSAKTAKKYKHYSTSSSGATGGISSSLVFTPVQGMEFVNPEDAEKQTLDTKDGTESYFSQFGGFRSITKST